MAAAKGGADATKTVSGFTTEELANEQGFVLVENVGTRGQFREFVTDMLEWKPVGYASG